MKKLASLTLAIFILFTTSACGSKSNSTIDSSTSSNIPVDMAYNYVEGEIKSILKNPSSLIINNISENAEVVEDLTYSYYQIAVDYSAQNGFGGYDRENTLYYIKISKSTSSITTLSEKEYIGAVNNALYKSKLDSIEASDRIPYSLICSDSTHDDVVMFLKKSNISFSDFDAKDYKEISYLAHIFNLEGVVEIDFDLKSKKLYCLEFSKYPEQFIYDNNSGELIYIDKDNTISIENVETIRKSISNALGFDGVDKDESSLSHYDAHSCSWMLKNNIVVQIKWDTLKEDMSVIFFSLTVTNSTS